MFHNNDTICAIASPPGAALRGVVRLSGPLTVEIVSKLCGYRDELSPAGPQRISAVIDLGAPIGPVDASVLLWPCNQSYTGAPSAEIHMIGSQPILSATLDAMLSAGARMAEPGEFTMRAFLAGRLDLVEAEAVLGVIDAQNDRALSTALRQLSGGLSAPLNLLRNRLLESLAHLEAGLDFVEEDIEFITKEELTGVVQSILGEVQDLVQQMRFREGDTSRHQIVLRGEPNAGKSSLINALSAQQIAIVSEQAGTTRDWVGAELRWDDIFVRLMDTAGVSNEPSEIEHKSQAMGESAQTGADLILLCVDATTQTLSSWQRSLFSDPSLSDRLIPVATKCDLGSGRAIAGDARWILTSSQSGKGIEELKERICETIGARRLVDAASVNATAMRCHEILCQADEALQRSLEIIDGGLGEELVASELRLALDAIGRVTGVVYTDDILDQIFSRFCIGK